MDKMREEFETWVETLPVISNKDLHWQTWQASRSALVVELPPEHEQAYGAYDGTELRYMLQQAGIKYE